MIGLYYRHKLRTYIFNESIDYALDKMLKDCITTGIKGIGSHNEFHCFVTFKDGTVYTFWNGNKYYCWLKDGHFKFASGGSYYYIDGRPTAKTMYLFRQALENFKFC